MQIVFMCNIEIQSIQPIYYTKNAILGDDSTQLMTPENFSQKYTHVQCHISARMYIHIYVKLIIIIKIDININVPLFLDIFPLLKNTFFLNIQMLTCILNFIYMYICRCYTFKGFHACDTLLKVIWRTVVRIALCFEF